MRITKEDYRALNSMAKITFLCKISCFFFFLQNFINVTALKCHNNGIVSRRYKMTSTAVIEAQSVHILYSLQTIIIYKPIHSLQLHRFPVIPILLFIPVHQHPITLQRAILLLSPALTSQHTVCCTFFIYLSNNVDPIF